MYGPAQPALQLYGDGQTSNCDERVAFATFLAPNRIAVVPYQLRHNLGRPLDITDAELCRHAKREEGVQAHRPKASLEVLALVPIPAFANGQEDWLWNGKVTGEQIPITRSGNSPEQITYEVISELWSGALVFISNRESVGDLVVKLDETWFIPQNVKYCRLIGGVLDLKIALNLLMRAALLFLQNTLSKVLVNNTMRPLKVLAGGSLSVSPWHVALS